ncbi:MAG TPA: hypothetical protein PK858_02580, partial [Saprospiraceae bacterium]|nr:hypothetical protein [Saprospiraceae bacterium]
MPKVPSIGFKRPIQFWTALVSFAAAAGYVCENSLIQDRQLFSRLPFRSKKVGFRPYFAAFL